MAKPCTARPRGPADNPALYRDCDVDGTAIVPVQSRAGRNAGHVQPFAVFRALALGLAEHRAGVARVTGVPRSAVVQILNRKPWERRFRVPDERRDDPADLVEEFL